MRLAMLGINPGANHADTEKTQAAEKYNKTRKKLSSGAEAH